MSFSDQDGAELFQENIRLKEDINTQKLKCERLERHPPIRYNQYRLEEDGLPKEVTDKQTSYDINSYQTQIGVEGKSRNNSKCLKYVSLLQLYTVDI